MFSFSIQTDEDDVDSVSEDKSLQNDDELSQAVNEDEDTLHPQPTKQAKSNDLPPGTLDSFSRSFKTGRRLTCVEIVRTACLTIDRLSAPAQFVRRHSDSDSEARIAAFRPAPETR
ncbi:hypothetical protein C0Q70_01084 [Pomacea canaliculata]|uniref:Uncharacterized protein n=1 Tax=Pomacea canaliculata TaxID=400727 RepID=A0A2T7PYI8_POMCA|nr:hypothetical protein C0Q70_01084 [Pomacea canaliculata]